MYFIYGNKSLSNKNYTHPSHISQITSQLSLNTNCSGFKRRINKRYELQDLEDLNMCGGTELFCLILEIFPTSVSIPFINCCSRILTGLLCELKVFYCLQDKIKFIRNQIFLSLCNSV